ncbi:glutamate 5-kinase [Candidatus Woesearchaeota archaeon]|nr:glutamate 5-kinase [Candidatus Woesearchaeota archaeon]
MAHKRIVVKIGTNLLTEKLCSLRADFISRIAKQIADLRKKGVEVLIVTSGAIGAGCQELNLKKSREIEVRQALAAVGQSSVMRAYHDAFSGYGIKVAQILLTYEDFSNRKRYLHLRKAVDKLISLDVMPVINENDTISVDEIGATFGDNDKLSALVASKVNADLLVMLSDIDGLYDKNPKTNKDAKLIRIVDSITKDIERAAGKSGSAFSIGGMLTKVKAARIALDSGCDMVICNGRKKDILSRAISGKEGTLFIAREKLSNRIRWIKFSRAKGKVIIDKGAEKALREGKSLLSVGIKKVEGDFDRKDIIEINDAAKGISDYSSKELEKIKGKKGKVAVKSGNIVLI